VTIKKTISKTAIDESLASKSSVLEAGSGAAMQRLRTPNSPSREPSNNPAFGAHVVTNGLATRNSLARTNLAPRFARVARTRARTRKSSLGRGAPRFNDRLQCGAARHLAQRLARKVLARRVEDEI